MRTTSVLAAATGLALAAGLVASCDSPTVPPRVDAYDFQYADGDSIVYRWPVGWTLGVHVVPSEAAGDDAALRAAFERMAEAWNTAVLYGEYRIAEAPLEDADVILTFGDDPLPVDISECAPLPTGVAWTTFCVDTETGDFLRYPLLEGQHSRDGVVMIVEVLRDQVPFPGRLDALITHEFGHVLGIGAHPCRMPGCPRGTGAYQSVMFGGIPERSGVSSADRSTVELLYRTRADFTAR